MRIGIDIDDVITNTSEVNKDILAEILRARDWVELKTKICAGS